MSHLAFSGLAYKDLERLYDFLAQFNRTRASDATETIVSQIEKLKQFPFKGSPVPDRPFVRKLVISFGATGYLAFYKYNPMSDTVQVLTLVHQKENYHLSHIGLNAEEEEGW